MKIVVYAICKNERSFADRWMASMSEADEVCVLDTGSTDGTPQRLEELGAKVSVQVITPWRFDVARNQSLELVPEDADLCVCTRFGRGVPAGLAGKGRGGGPLVWIVCSTAMFGTSSQTDGRGWCFGMTRSTGERAAAG